MPAWFPPTGRQIRFPDNLIPADYGMDLDPLRVNPDDPGSALLPKNWNGSGRACASCPGPIVMSVQDMFGRAAFTLWFSRRPAVEKACSIEMILPTAPLLRPRRRASDARQRKPGPAENPQTRLQA